MNLARTAATAALNAVNTLCNTGTLTIYSGTQPATPQTALSGNTALATFAFTGTAFGSSAFNASPTSAMEASANFSATSVSPSASGTATFARLFQSDGTTVVGDYTVGTSGTDLIIGSTSINTGVPVTVSSFKHRMPAL